ncbi:hypothetical protein ABK040_003456 [Willaertia magna]
MQTRDAATSIFFLTASSLLAHFQMKRQGNLTKVKKTEISAPGKVLITGGYLVLDPSYTGLVLSTSSRFYTIINDIINTESNLVISLSSPQFHFQRTYQFIQNVDSFELKSDSEESNPYIENSMLYALSICTQFVGKLKGKISIELKADNDFYSQRQNLIDLGKEVNLDNLQKLDKCYVCPNANKKINKTGLGSSAAMVTSLVSALIVHFTGLDIINNNDNREVVHRIAQYCHCLAQGKIGSGFDVSAAIFGSQKYKRFNEKILQPIMKGVDFKVLKCSNELLGNIMNIIKKDITPWDNEHIGFELPPNFHLFVADVEQGSNTPSMVRSVLKWRENNTKEANELWNSIKELNDTVEDCFKVLSKEAKENPQVYNETLNELYEISAEEWGKLLLDQETTTATIDQATIVKSKVHVVESMVTIRKSFYAIRSKLKYMGQQAYNEPIEPEQQTELLNQTMNVNGCLIAGVPGAGGYDAVFSILFTPNSDEESLQQVKHSVESVWKEFEKTNDCHVTPLLLNESKTKGLECKCINN